MTKFQNDEYINNKKLNYIVVELLINNQCGKIAFILKTINNYYIQNLFCHLIYYYIFFFFFF